MWPWAYWLPGIKDVSVPSAPAATAELKIISRPTGYHHHAVCFYAQFKPLLERYFPVKTAVRIATAIFIALAITFPAGAHQKAPTSNFLPQAAGAHREHHPHIRAALRELQEAKQELQTADHDFGGHREEALKSCTEAIRQLQQALQYDKK
jgi:hypothetical protein